MTLRSAFADAMYDVMERDESVVVLLGDIGVFSFKRHAERWPTRVINAGVAECAMVGMAAGLAASGLYPVVSTISSFLVRRAYEFIYLDFGLQRLPGLFVGIGGANEYAKLGLTHLCPEHMTLMSHVPGMDLLYPWGDVEVGTCILGALSRRELAYVSLEERK